MASAKGHARRAPYPFPQRSQTKRNPRQQDELTSQAPQVIDFVDKMLYKLFTVAQGIITAITSPEGSVENKESKNDISFGARIIWGKYQTGRERER